MHLKSSWHRLEPSHFSPRFWNNPAPARPSSPRRAGPAGDSGRRRREAGRQREEQRARGAVQTKGLAERANESAAAKWADRGGRKGPGSRPPRQIGEKGERAQSVWKQGVLTSGSGWRGWPGWMDLRPHPTAARGGRASSCLAEAEPEVGPGGDAGGFNENGPRSFWGYWCTLGYGQLECAKLFSSSQRQN